MSIRTGKFSAMARIAAAVCLVTAPAAFGDSTGPVNDEAAIRSADHERVVAAHGRRAAAWLDFYTGDAMVQAPHAPMATDPDNIRALIVALLARPGLAIDWQPVRIEVAGSGDLGYLVGRFDLRFEGADGVPVHERGGLLEIWRKQTDGRWKCSIDTWNADQPSAAAPSAEPLTPAQVMAIDYGAMPTDYRHAIEQYFQRVLKFPESIEYRDVTSPEQGFVKTLSGVFVGRDTYHYGWTVKATVNAKNSFGGYVGFKTYTFLFRGERIVKTIAPTAEDEIQ
jgi:ketosteroid isomerase-like protein